MIDDVVMNCADLKSRLRIIREGKSNHQRGFLVHEEELCEGIGDTTFGSIRRFLDVLGTVGTWELTP